MSFIIGPLLNLCQKYQKLADEAEINFTDYFMYRTPYPVAIIVTLYFYVVFCAGPKFMKNRQPFDLRRIVSYYNLFQVLINFYIFANVLNTGEYFGLFCCTFKTEEEFLRRLIFRFANLYYLVKILDLIDTVFFVLRKKQSHVTFLHVYHHSMMVAMGWIVMRVATGGHFYYVVLLNSLVHVVMYLYYFLSATEATKTLVAPWKKFVTLLQLLQFVCLFLIFAQSVFQPPECRLPYGIPFLFLTQDGLMIYLFSKFYYNNYIKVKSQ